MNRTPISVNGSIFPTPSSPKNTAERDSLIAQKRVETLKSLNEEKERIIQQLQRIQQEKDELRWFR